MWQEAGCRPLRKVAPLGPAVLAGPVSQAVGEGLMGWVQSGPRGAGVTTVTQAGARRHVDPGPGFSGLQLPSSKCRIRSLPCSARGTAAGKCAGNRGSQVRLEPGSNKRPKVPSS